VRSRGPVLLALVALGALVAVLVNAFFVGGSGTEPATAAPPAPAAATSNEAAAEVAAPPAPAETAQVETTPGGLVYDDDSRDPVKPKLAAKAYIAIDAETGEVLAAKQDRRRLPIASLTKMMTALLVIEEGELDRKIRVNRKATLVEPNKEGLVASRWYPRRLLLYSTLLESANDSADALAYAAARGNIGRFYDEMNERAEELAMTDTLYASASGLEDETNVSSARDQAIVAREALENRTFAKIVRTRRKMVEWPPPTYSKEWINHNRLLFTYDGAYGVKTGYTSKAGSCLVAAARRDGHEVVAVVLGSQNIWQDMPRLLDEAFARIEPT
jgi:D-alanyl-D-alanine carboxypeptidase